MKNEKLIFDVVREKINEAINLCGDSFENEPSDFLEDNVLKDIVRKMKHYADSENHDAVWWSFRPTRIDDKYLVHFIAEPLDCNKAKPQLGGDFPEKFYFGMIPLKRFI